MDASLIFRVAGIGIIVSIFYTLLKQAGKDEQAYLVTLVGVVVVLVMVVRVIGDLFRDVRTIFQLY